LSRARSSSKASGWSERLFWRSFPSGPVGFVSVPRAWLPTFSRASPRASKRESLRTESRASGPVTPARVVVVAVLLAVATAAVALLVSAMRIS
jgi:hypothetical protein